MNEDHIHIEQLTASGVKELQQIGRQTFHETFAEDNTTENMKYYLETAFAHEQLLKEINDPDSAFFIARVKGRAIGYLKINSEAAQNEPQSKRSLEIERIYVLQEFQGKKVGQLLFQKALEIAYEHQVEYLWLGVWEKNQKAIRFYEKNGFIPFDTHLFILGDDEQTDILMKLVLGDNKKGALSEQNTF